MTDNDERLDAQLREYYAQLAQQPAPDLTGRVMASADTRAARVRRLTAVGGALAVAAAAVVLVVVALANHGVSPRTTPANSSTPQPNPTATPAVTPQAPVVPVGPPVQGFIPSDVTAVSAGQWWVMGYDGASCSSASCTRILHTGDGGHTFESIPTPPVAPGQAAPPFNNLRFADPLDGWMYTGPGALWATHDGGGHWTSDARAGRVTDLEASGGYVYAVACAQGDSCLLERSPTGQDVWSVLPTASGSGALGHLNVNGPHIWVVPGGQGGTSLLASGDDGQHFTTNPVCPGLVGIASLSAVDPTVLWATCVTGTQAVALRSVDGGAHFTTLPRSLMLANFASIGGVSSTTAVIGAQALLRTVDGGLSFATVEDNHTQWSVVGFTTSVNGFVLDTESSTQRALWRTNDSGAHWYKVQFP
jgi:photosystem II stability/assembly factor-like uncharacterized protein